MDSPGADVGSPDCAPWVSSCLISEKKEWSVCRLTSAGNVVSSGGKEVSIDGSAGTDESKAGMDESIAGNDESMGGMVLSIAGKVESIVGSAGKDDSIAAGALVVSAVRPFCDSVDCWADSPGGLAGSVDSVISKDYSIPDKSREPSGFLRGVRVVRRSLGRKSGCRIFFRETLYSSIKRKRKKSEPNKFYSTRSRELGTEEDTLRIRE